MKKIYLYGLTLVSVLLSGAFALGQDDGSVKNDNYSGKLGTVQFPVSCNEAARQHAERGLALLHHMTYVGSRAMFVQATEADPECAMGYWGQAMSYIHPLWSDPPSKADFEKGRELVNEAIIRGRKTDWEQAFIAAVDAYYAQGQNQSEKKNLAGFEKGWQLVYEQFPDNIEAACFYALAHLSTADPSDKSYTKQEKTAGLARQVLIRIPDHPGAHHYIIHAYDYPPLAQGSLEVARSYGGIAPDVPHSLHMPTHIFTRLGLWQESIEMNKRSAAAALSHPAGGKISLHYLHAFDYLAYAYLQQADDEKAKAVLETVNNINVSVQPHVATAYTFAALPARYTLERQQWSDAVSLKPRIPKDYPWDRFPAMEGLTYFARALGAARNGDVKAAQAALDKMKTLQVLAASTSPYWAKQVEIQLLSVQAWLEFQQGNQEQALTTMLSAAELEATTEKHPVTPGEVLPARELLADMLLEAGNYKEAHGAYLSALERSPNRFNSLYGAARSAELRGDDKTAASYYRKLVEMTSTDAKRERLQMARAFLATN